MSVRGGSRVRRPGSRPPWRPRATSAPRPRAGTGRTRRRASRAPAHGRLRASRNSTSTWTGAGPRACGRARRPAAGLGRAMGFRPRRHECECGARNRAGGPAARDRPATLRVAVDRDPRERADSPRNASRFGRRMLMIPLASSTRLAHQRGHAAIWSASTA
jgi:hypothetical protein